MVLSNNERGWLLAVCSGIACVLGSFIICSDVVLRRFKRFENFNIREDKRILVYGFSLSSGVMILTAMYELLPEGFENVVNSPSLYDQQTPSGLVVMASYILGVAIFSVLNLVIHAVTQRSVVHCAHESMDDGHGHSHSHGHSSSQEHDCARLHSHESHEHSHSHSTEPHNHECNSEPIIVANYGSTMSERSPLMLEIGRSVHTEENMDATEMEAELYSTSSTISSLPDAVRVDFNKLEKSSSCSTSSAPSTVINDVNGTDPTGRTVHLPSTAFADMLSIGMQTSLAISLHKIPEGFITFATSYANPELGLSVFIAIAIHNFIEGFTIAFPLYLALGSRWMALGAAFVLGGLSQPAGALIGWLVFGGQQPETEGSMVYGVLFGIVGGFLTIIALQMFATAVNYSRKPNVCINWAFAGSALVGIAISLGDV
ncbi:ZIP zinc transporter-domain-containing protein [Lipomyces chichibuensis]|uniref:ZIP zinc transporter-domain-containing protein n=1 Tax=Lipomyces chichibuensis TaxID=1546026 RepID=UPI003343A7F4